ncbi:MAG: glycosyltransferase family 39 protein [candidate division WOR-3 bacterium]|nr:glycosyltransferase family 39 protein [candidate division WOR-3 bacterium]
MSKKHKTPKTLPAKKIKGISLSDRNIFLILFLVFLILMILLYDPKLFLGGDNAHYIILGKSLLQGTGYRDILAPGSPPHTLYPPGFPLIIIPGLILFGDNYGLLKFIVIALALGSFAIFYSLLRRRTDSRNWLLPMAILAVSPIILEYSHWLLSEIPFLFFSILAFYLFERFEILKKDNLFLFLLMAISVTFIFFIRSIGISLVLACLVYLLYKRRWRELIVLAIIAALFIIPWQIRNSKVGSQAGGYFQQFLARNPYEPELGNINFSEYVSRVLANFKLYAFFVIPQILFPSLTSSSLLNVLGFALLVFLIIGLVNIIKKKSIGVWEIYLVIFMVITLSWPQVWSGDRFLIPILPFLIYYIFVGLSQFSQFVKFKVLTQIILGLMIILALVDSVKKIPPNLANLSAYLNGDKYAGYPMDWQRYFETLKWIKENTENDAIVVSRKPPFTYLLGQRKSFLFLFSNDVDQIISDFYQKKASYILFDSFYWSGTTRKYIGPLLQARPDKFELLYKSQPPEMYVFRIK